MPEAPVFIGSSVRRAGRWVLVGGLLLALLLIGVFDEPLLAFLTAWWQRGLAVVGLRQQVNAMQQGISRGITTRLLPAVATYAVLYLGICLLLLRLLVATPAQWRLVLRLYAGSFVVYVGVVLLGKALGNAVWAYRLSRQVLDFVVSPIPVLGLFVLLRAGLGQAPPRT